MALEETSSDKSSSSSSHLSFYTGESCIDTESSSDLESTMARHAMVARKTTHAKVKEKRAPDKLNNALAIQLRLQVVKTQLA